MRLLRYLRPGLVLLIVVCVVASGCAAHRAYRQGKSEAKKGNWDMAVARMTKALDKDPDNIEFKIALENARIQASRHHYEEGRKHLAAEELEKAVDELEIAAKYDPSNRLASDDLFAVRERIRKREEQRERLKNFDAMKEQARAQRPRVIIPQSNAPITLKFTDTSLQKIFETLGKLAGINLVFDGDFRDKRSTVNLVNVTFEQALDQLTLVNRLFYKALDQSTLIIVPESPQKRRSYDENLMRTFYLQNADVNETVTLVRNLTGLTKVAGNVGLGAITAMGTPDELALAERIIENNDKAKGEVMVEVEVLEVNRSKLRDYGIALSNYTAAATLAPTGAEGELTRDKDNNPVSTNIRAHLLSSLNLSDFVVTIPSSIFTRFLRTEANGRLVASPRLRAAEGKKTTLKIVSQIPVPQTTFQATNTGGSTLTPLTNVVYKDVGVILDLTPKVNVNGDIALEMSVEFSLRGADTQVQGQTLPTFNTRNINGILRLRDGQTSLIGGLISGAERESLSGALGINKIPLLNKVLGSHTHESEESEVIISITPHIVRAPHVTPEDLETLDAGTKETIKVLTGRGPLLGPVPTPTPSPSPAASPVPGAAASPAATAAPAPPAPSPVTTLPAGPPASPPGAEAPAQAAPGLGRIMARLTPQGLVKVGEAGTINLFMSGTRDTPILAMDVELSFDPALMEVTSVSAGPVLSVQGTPPNLELQPMENGKTRVKITAPKGFAGNGIMIVIGVKPLQPQVTQMSAPSLTLTTAEGTTTVTVMPARFTVTP